MLAKCKLVIRDFSESPIPLLIMHYICTKAMALCGEQPLFLESLGVLAKTLIQAGWLKDAAKCINRCACMYTPAIKCTVLYLYMQ